ncbi:Transposase [Crocosphaera watsonii WH 8502]|uniref:Transposase n=1 Tax=Crocosphaera watsonii WH 8502 TaxID=423474 RepID=T2IEH8_CROWT|nr:Transposase [Crocosphaera watsonii WH 8502]
MIKAIICKEFKTGSRLIITIDRTQWKDKNVFMVAVIWKKLALPIYWTLLGKRGASRLSEQQALIQPVLCLLKNYELVILGDREFHSVKLAYWLKQKVKTKVILRFSSETRYKPEKR